MPRGVNVWNESRPCRYARDICGHRIAPQKPSACGGVPDVVTGKTDIQFLKSGIGGKSVVFGKVRIGLRLAEGFEKVFRGVRGD
jgi:hypothetical protein